MHHWHPYNATSVKTSWVSSFFVEISLSLRFSRGIDHRYLNNIQLFNEGSVPERSGKVEYERERLAGNR